MNLKILFNRPEYIFRPSQLLRRISMLIKRKKDDFISVKLPWGVKIKVHFEDEIGRSICNTGIYDMAITEVLWRLTDQGDSAIDVGANIGYMTSIMSVRVGKTGRVICFEPHPQIYNELYRNVKHWQKMYDWNHIETYSTALSDVKGKGFLKAPLENNLGTASLIQFDSVDGPLSYREDRINIHNGNAGHNGYIVLKDRLDNKLEKLNIHQVDVLKIDVEGHELQVLKGVERLLSRKAIRDIIFEDFSCYWRPTGEFLKDFDVLSDNGYMIFKISKGFLKPLLDSPLKFFDISQNFDPINYLATIDPDRAVHRLQNKGWSSLWYNS